jgi:putative RNA 2'-phosphotransferase
MLHPSLIERITRSLAYMLRHQPEQFDLELDEYGYADMDDVVAALNERLGEPVEADDVVQAVDGGDRPRYEIREGRIRALYGHSIQVKPGETAKPPALLYVGISKADAERAQRYGLRPGRRSFLHLALTPEDALETGRRASRDYAVVTVNAIDAWEEGINFYDRKSLFLSDPIPTQFLQVGDVHSDGYGEEEGQERGRGPRGPVPRRDERSESPRRREWRDRPVDRGPERVPERGSERVPERAPERAEDRAVESEPPREEAPALERAPERVPERGAEPRGGRGPRGDPHGHRGRDRHGRGESRPPRDDRGGRHDHGGRHEPREGGLGPAREGRGGYAPRPAPAPAPAASQPPAPRPSVPDNFGSGIFEAEKSQAAARARPPEPRPQPTPAPEEARPAREREKEPARGEPDDRGFGAGL